MHSFYLFKTERCFSLYAESNDGNSIITLIPLLCCCQAEMSSAKCALMLRVICALRSELELGKWLLPSRYVFHLTDPGGWMTMKVTMNHFTNESGSTVDLIIGRKRA